MTTDASPSPPPASDGPDREQTRARGGPCTCGAWIRWVQTVGGALMPIDPDPHPDGTVVPVVVDGERRARVLPAAELELHNGARFMPHWSTCPHAVRHRQRPPATDDALEAVRGVFEVDEL